MSSLRTRVDLGPLAVRILAAVVLLGVWGVVIARDVPAQEEADREEWVNRYQTLRSELEELRVRVEMLDAQYTQSRRRNYPRGEPLKELIKARQEAHAELAEKEEEWANFPEEARRAGALPGWFRE